MSSEPDYELDMESVDASSMPASLTSNVLGTAGWDPVRHTTSNLTDCDGKLRVFHDAVFELKALLESGSLVADTAVEILALTRYIDEPWARFVDPDRSRPKSSPTIGTLLVMWECSDHSVGLHDVGQRKWKIVSGAEVIEDLREELEMAEFDGDDELDADEPETYEMPPIGVDLEPADIEHRDLMDKRKRSQVTLEPLGDSAGDSASEGEV